jgi:hypothetical protein
MEFRSACLQGDFLSVGEVFSKSVIIFVSLGQLASRSSQAVIRRGIGARSAPVIASRI